MADKTNRSVLGDDWYKSFSQLRLQPDLFLDKRKLTRDAFCLDVLKELYLDHIETQYKIHLLLILQEHCSLLITDANLLQQTVGSLTNLYLLLGQKLEKRFLRSQIIIAITTVLLSTDVDSDVYNLIRPLKSLLLKTIYGNSADSVVVSSACRCLEEIEMFCPGILESDMKNILLACEKHLSPAYQNYVTLLSLCAKNLTTKATEKDVPFPVTTSPKSSEEKNQVLPIVSFSLELLPYMTHMASYRVLKDLIHVVKYTSNLLPTVFKFFLPNLLMSSEVISFHLALNLLEEFELDLFTTQEESFLLNQISVLCTHPCLTSSHRLLYLDWLKSSFLKKGLFSCPFPNIQHLLPCPFDGPLTQEKKSCVLAVYISKSDCGNLGADFLNECASGLKKCALLPGGTKSAASFFRTLYVYFVNIQMETMHNSLYKSLLNIMKSSPHLSPYALSFLQSIKEECSEKKFSGMAFSHMVDHILSLPLKQFTSNLEYYLAILESAAQESGSVCKPRSVLRLLQKLVSEAVSWKKNEWSFGNDILAVCQAFLKYQDVQIFYYDLAEVLYMVTQSINDVDVKDRAAIYYSMLTSLSKLKVQSIFKLQSSEKDTKNPLTSFVPGGNPNLQFAPCMQNLNKPVLQFLRIKNDPEVKVKEFKEIPKNISTLEVYFQYLTTYQAVVALPFILAHVRDVDKAFLNLYGVVISAQSSPQCKKISVIEIPVLKEKTSGQVVFLKLIPAEACPLTLHFKAEFTCNNGYSYSCQLESVTLKFEDLFLPLPVPEILKQCELSWRQSLFEALWQTYEQQMLLEINEAKCCHSAFCLKVNKEDLPAVVEGTLKPFIVARFPNYIYFIAIYVPPRNHFLMKISIVNDKPFVTIFTDNISLLPWINLYLKEINKT